MGSTCSGSVSWFRYRHRSTAVGSRFIPGSGSMWRFSAPNDTFPVPWYRVISQLPPTRSWKAPGRQSCRISKGLERVVPLLVRAAERVISGSVGRTQFAAVKVPSCRTASVWNCRPSERMAVKEAVVSSVHSLGTTDTVRVTVLASKSKSVTFVS